MKVTKASGFQERFRPRKIYDSIIDAGGSKDIAKEASKMVQKKFHENITTKEILEIILNVLKKEKGVFERYDLKRAIMSLGPSGFPFEQFFSDLLTHYGYKTKVDNFLKGKRIIHEVDIVAENEKLKKTYMIECKYHNESGTITKLHPALYTYARFLDLQKKFDMPWLVTNTKCSRDAVEYSKGVGLKITSWNYPKTKSLKKLIVQKKLYPITILKAVNEKTKEKLFSLKIVLAKKLLDYSISHLSKEMDLDENEIRKILDEVREVCEIK